MSGFGTVEDTMFIPMLGRIYASEMHPQILYDKKALSLKEKLPSGLMEKGKQSQYTLLASASGFPEAQAGWRYRAAGVRSGDNV